MQQTKTASGEKWYALSATEALQKLNVNAETGLTTAEAQTRQGKYGRNELPTGEGTSLITMIIEQFKDVTVLLLIIAAFISIGLGHGKDSIVILIIVALNAFIGVYQERQAENALAALAKMQTPLVRTRRNGQVSQLSATELVPGDIVLLEGGDSVPADGRLIYAVNVKIDEAAMTGESMAVDKESNALPDSATPPPIAERTNFAYMGTALTYGRAELLVTDTGLDTQLGNIAALLQNVENTRTPLQDRLEQLGFVLAGAAITVCVIVFFAGVLRGEEVSEMFLTAVSLAVAAVPEGLPAVITVALALGANRMIKRNALIRKLPAVETLGSVTVICSDKTGTLTRNEMTATQVVLPDQEPVIVTGVGYEPVGEFRIVGKNETLHVSKDDQLGRAIIAAALCTDAYLNKSGDDAQWSIVGDTTEGALLVLAQKQGWSREALQQDLPRVAEIPFTSERKSMTTVHKPVNDAAKNLFNGANYVAFTKGAPDQLLGWTSQESIAGGQRDLTEASRQGWQNRIDELAKQGIRVLGIGYRTFDEMPDSVTPETVERNLILLGLVGIVDPPRVEAGQAVAVAQGAGIRPIMITGDHKLTAQSIAKQLGIIQNEANAQVIEGSELDQLTPAQLQERVKTVSVFARVSPEHKLRVVEALQKNGEIVAMTGDGVNDAPALKQANIGVAMGITGTDVSKGAADMVLTDDNFASIVSAVEEGRTIYDNIRKFIRYLMGSNMGEIVAMFIAIIIGFKPPLMATQILWVNLVTDGLPAIALGFGASESSVMHRKPRPPRESIFARGLGIHVLWVGAWMGMMTLLGYVFALQENSGDIFNPDEEHLTQARTLAFFILAITQLFHVMAIHAGHTSIFHKDSWNNRLLLTSVGLTILLQLATIYVPFLQNLLHTTPLTVEELIIGTVFASSVLVVVEIEKYYRRQRESLEIVE